MDSLIVNVEPPTLVRELPVSVGQPQRIVGAYILAFACSLLSLGAKAQRKNHTMIKGRLSRG